MLPISKGLLGMPKHGLVQRAFASNGRLINLNEISNIDGATKLRKRWGRGTGSGRGKLCGFGHQKSRSTPRGFEGGQTPLYKRLPKIGFHNPNHIDYEVVNLEKLQQFIDMGRLKVAENSWVTTRDLLACGLISRLRDGVKILANGKEQFKTPIHLEVSSASREAIRAVEAAGGSVTAVHFNALALRAVAKPYKFDLLPGRARPPPKRMGYYLDRNRAGYLSPEVQTRNLKLFGAISSEEMYQKQHQAFMEQKRRSKQ